MGCDILVFEDCCTQPPPPSPLQSPPSSKEDLSHWRATLVLERGPSGWRGDSDRGGAHWLERFLGLEGGPRAEKGPLAGEESWGWRGDPLAGKRPLAGKGPRTGEGPSRWNGASG